MRKYLCCFIAVAVVAVIGCAKTDKPEGLPDLFPCEITITQDGKPLAGANVVFFGDQKWAVGGGTAENGVAKIYTHGKFEGAPSGKYKVTVTKTITEGGPTEADLNNPSYSGGYGKQYDVIDKKFRSAETTTLEIDVAPGKNTKTLDVEKAVKVEQPKV